MKIIIRISVLMFALSALVTRPEARPIDPTVVQDNSETNGPSLYPEPTTQDRIIQNVGNIVTSVENWGRIGGYPGYLPSGEWPRNSGHDYLAEICYWMGAVTADGDTLVVNTHDDCQGMRMPVGGVDDYTMYLSTDSTRYYNYDPSDTVGLGAGSPAQGWRIWNPTTRTYEYNTVYNSLDSSFADGGPNSLQDSYYRFNDVALGSSVMGLEITQTIMQWNYCYNEDFMFIALDITNTSTVDYAEFAIGIYVDIDVGGYDGLGGNGRLEDAVVYDQDNNWAYIYDVVGIDPGWGPDVQTGFMGTRLLETPDSIGMTALRTDDWGYLPTDDAGRFAMINSEQFDTPLPPTDQFYIQCVRGINLTAGSTARIVYALVAGADSVEFVGNSEMAQTMYDNYFVGPQPPPVPTLHARAGNQKIYLNWGDKSETAIDGFTGENDFAGYKLYRSDNLGRTWGTVDHDNENACLAIEYFPLAKWDVDHAGDLIAHSYIDEGLTNGVEYWYCLVAFDHGDEVVDPLQSGFGIAGEAPNVISIRPEADPAGYYEAATTVEHTYTGDQQPSEGDAIPTVFDQSLLTGAEYSVVFEDTPENTYWHLINNTSGDTVLDHQTTYNADPEFYEVAEGLRVVVTNPDVEPTDISQTGMAGSATTLVVAEFFGPSITYLGAPAGWELGYARYRATYELRYTQDSTVTPWIWGCMLSGNWDPITVPFEVWNTTTNQRVSLTFDAWDYHDTWQPGDTLVIVDSPYDPDSDLDVRLYYSDYVWAFNLDAAASGAADGDVLTVEGALLSGPGDVFTFQIDGINTQAAAANMKNIKVVPNPYFVQYSSRVETVEGQSMLFFNNLPNRCTIRIYNLAGDLVRTLEHEDDSGSESWDLLSSNAQLVAAGIYLFHVESPYGEHLGRFAIVK